MGRRRELSCRSPQWSRCMAMCATMRSGHAYSPGRHGPVINLGEGTTGTRFLSCVFQRLGFRTSHNELISDANDYSSLSEYDYISDNPMNMQGAHILATRHGG